MRISDYIRTYSVENGSLITSLTGDTWGVLGAHMTAFGSGYTGDTATVTVTNPGAVTGGAAIEGIVTDGEIRSCRVTSAGQYQQTAGVIDTSYYYLIARLGSSSFTGADEQGRIFLGNGATISGTGYVAAIPILTFGGAGTGAAGIAIVGPTSLDAIPTLDLQEGKQVSVRLDDTTLSMWRLVAATDAEDGTTVIRPGDYYDLPVKMVWKLQTTSTAVPANLSVTTLTTTGNVTSGGDVILSNSGAVRLPDADGSNYIELQAANVVATNTVYKFPEDGAAGQVLSTDGGGNLSWTSTGAASQNLSTTDQVLTGNRNVTLNGSTLTFTGSSDSLAFDTAGNVTASGNLTVSGTTSLQGTTTTTLSTSGAVTHAAAVTHNNTADFNGAITIDAGATVNTSPLTIAGSTSLVVNGVLDSNSTADFSGAANFTGTTAFSNTNTFTGDISANNTSTFSDTLVATNVVSFTGASAVGMAGTNSLSGTNLFSGTNSFSATARMLNGAGITFFDSDNSNTTILQANPTTTSNVTYSLPAADGASGQVLQTNGSGLLSWTNQTATGSDTNLGNTDQTLTAARSVSINGQSLNIAGTAATWAYASTGHASTTGNLTVAGTTALAGTTTTTLTTSGAVVHGSTVTFNGSTDFNAAANFDNGVTVNNNPLVVSGTTTAQVNGVLDVNGIADFAGASTFTGTTSFSNTNTFTGAISASNTASFTGTLTASNSVSFTGSSAVGMAGTNGFTGTNIFSGTNSFTATARMLNGNGVTFFDSDNSNTTILRAAPTTTSNVTYSLPPADGTSGQVLSTNGSGTLSWITSAGGSGTSLATTDQTLTASRNVDFNGQNLSFTGSAGTWAWQGDGDLLASNVDCYWGSGKFNFGGFNNTGVTEGDLWLDSTEERWAFRDLGVTRIIPQVFFVGIGGTAITALGPSSVLNGVHTYQKGSNTIPASLMLVSKVIRIRHNAQLLFDGNQTIDWNILLGGATVGQFSTAAAVDRMSTAQNVSFLVDIVCDSNGATFTATAYGSMTYHDANAGEGKGISLYTGPSGILSVFSSHLLDMTWTFGQVGDETYTPISTTIEII